MAPALHTGRWCRTASVALLLTVASSARRHHDANGTDFACSASDCDERTSILLCRMTISRTIYDVGLTAHSTATGLIGIVDILPDPQSRSQDLAPITFVNQSMYWPSAMVSSCVRTGQSSCTRSMKLVSHEQCKPCPLISTPFLSTSLMLRVA